MNQLQQLGTASILFVIAVSWFAMTDRTKEVGFPLAGDNYHLERNCDIPDKIIRVTPHIDGDFLINGESTDSRTAPDVVRGLIVGVGCPVVVLDIDREMPVKHLVAFADAANSMNTKLVLGVSQ